MKKRNSIIYWISTAWLSLGMLSSGLVQLLHMQKETQFILDLGYPSYVLSFLGISKLAAVIVILIPGLKLLKEWAYAGLFFMMSGAVFSHFSRGNSFSDTAPALLLLSLVLISYLFRPANRRLIQHNIKHQTA